MKEILKSFVKEKGLDFNKMIFKYEDKEIDINKNYDDFANSEEKKYSRLILYYYVRSPKSPITINFIHKKFSKYVECFLEDKIRDIVNKYCSENQMNINNLVFKHGNIPINLDNNFFYLNSKEPNKGDETSSNFSMNKNQKILEIMVIDKIKDDSKIPLKNIVIIIGIIIVIIIVMIIIITVPKKIEKKMMIYQILLTVMNQMEEEVISKTLMIQTMIILKVEETIKKILVIQTMMDLIMEEVILEILMIQTMIILIVQKIILKIQKRQQNLQLKFVNQVILFLMVVVQHQIVQNVD